MAPVLPTMLAQLGSRLQHALTWSLRFGMVLAVLLLVLELIVRTWIHAPASRRLDENFGPVLRPNRVILESQEGFARHTTDNEGRVDRSLLGTVSHRVLLLGDSFSVAQEVQYGERFSEVVEMQLPGVEILNQADSGWYPPYYAAWLRQNDLVDIDAVVVQISEGDLFELHRRDRIRVERSPDSGWELITEPFQTEMSRVRSLSRRLSSVSALYELTRWRARLLLQMEEKRLASHFRAAIAQTETGVGERVPSNAVEILTSLHELMRAEHSVILYVYIPRLDYTVKGGRVRWPEAREVLHEFAVVSGAVLVDPTERMLEDFALRRRPHHGFHNSVMGRGHLNPRGHAVVGRELADNLQAVLR